MNYANNNIRIHAIIPSHTLGQRSFSGRNPEGYEPMDRLDGAVDLTREDESLPPLGEGKIVSWKKGPRVADGPFAESKEAIGAYFLLRVPTLEEAVEIAKQCPTLEHGSDVEVRPIAAECPHFQRAKEALAHATA